MGVRRRRISATVLVAALSTGMLAGCVGVPADEAEATASSASPSTTPKWSPSPKLPPPPQDAAVSGPLSRAALPAPSPFYSPRGGTGAGRTGPFTLRRWVNDFRDGDKQLLADLRLMRFRRGYHRFAVAPDGQSWMHIYLFECHDNWGASSLESMLWGDNGTAEAYQPQGVGDALGEVVRTRDQGGTYTKVEIAFVEGNVWARVMVGFRGTKGRTELAERFAEKLTLAEQHLLRSRFAPVV